MTDEKRRDMGENVRDGVRAVFGVVGALKDAIEETFQELLDRGELSPERAREAARSTMQRAQETMEDMRDRLEWVSRREFEALRDEVAALRRMLEEHRAEPGGAAHVGHAPTATQATPAATPASPPAGAPEGIVDAEGKPIHPPAADEPPRFTIDEG
jgi:polyhydroxyalkanoate synthesis regulator phasin